MRKKPRQIRSKALAQLLIDSTALVIAEQGLDAATTVSVAKRAGVSVGSLYQYFDSKEDLYEGVIEQLAGRLEAIVFRNLSTHSNQEISSFIRTLLDDVWSFLEANNGLYLNIVGHWVQLGALPVLAGFEQKLMAALGIYMAQNPPSKPIPNLQTKVYILVNAVVFTLIRFISNPPSGVAREQLLASLTELATNLIDGR